jgi:hypothetical protein
MDHVLASRAAGMQDALRAAGAQAQHIGDLWNGTLALCTFVFVAIVVATIIAVWCAPPADAATRPHTSSLEGPEHRIWRRVGWAMGLSVAGLLALLAHGSARAGGCSCWRWRRRWTVRAAMRFPPTWRSTTRSGSRSPVT